MNKHPYYSIDIENGARILLTPCPGTQGVELETPIKTLKQEAINRKNHSWLFRFTQ